MVARCAVLLALMACGSGRATHPAALGNTEPAPTTAVPTEAPPSRVIERSARGGVLELAGDPDQALAAARRDMAAHCGADTFTILQDHEELAGTRRGADGHPEPVIARRVHYVCVAPPPP